MNLFTIGAVIQDLFTERRYNEFYFRVSKNYDIVPYCDNDDYNFGAVELEHIKKLVLAEFPIEDFAQWVGKLKREKIQSNFSVCYSVDCIDTLKFDKNSFKIVLGS